METTCLLGSLSVLDVSTHLNVSKQCVRNWITHGVNGCILKSYKIAGKRRICNNDLEEFLESVTTEGFPQKEPSSTPAQRSREFRKAQKKYDSYCKKFSKN